MTNEFDGIWKQVTQGLAQAGKTFADEGQTEEGAKDQYRKIAERRVRLGLVLGEIGDKSKIQVGQEELRRARDMPFVPPCPRLASNGSLLSAVSRPSNAGGELSAALVATGGAGERGRR